MSAFVHLVCDYADGDMAWAEVVAALACRLHEDTRLHRTAVHPLTPSQPVSWWRSWL